MARLRDPADRRAVVVRALNRPNAEMMHLYSAMNRSMDGICADYQNSELEVIADFLHRTASAGQKSG